MPKAKAKPKPVAPVAPTPPPELILEDSKGKVLLATTADPRPVVWDKLEVNEFSTAVPRGPLTVAEMKEAMGWETEKEYQKRKVAEEGGELAHYIFGEDYHCKNTLGEKVRCWKNLNNRPFDEKWCLDLIHTHLFGQWAGPHTIPGETVNGETIRISKYNNVISGQHSMTSAILANEILQRDRESGLDHPDSPKYPVWRKQGQVFLETIVVTGMSEDPRVLMTVDYVKPRTVADVFYTSGTFKDANRQDRKELCRVLAIACDFLWTRTDARGYRTHLEVVGFLERHPRLLQCVEHLFRLNRATKLGGRRLSNLHLSAGQCAAVCYLMGCSVPDDDDGRYGDEYRNMNPAPGESGTDDKGKKVELVWSYWERSTEVDESGVLVTTYHGKAADFWTLLTSGPSEQDFAQVRKALGQLITSDKDNEDNMGMGGRLDEKLAILAKAWAVWKDHPEDAGAPFTEEDRAYGGSLFLTYTDYGPDGKKLADGKINLADVADFYGIDSPDGAGKGKESVKRDPPPIEYTDDEMEKMREDARARRTTGASAKK